jgi:hypothetical protein
MFRDRSLLRESFTVVRSVGAEYIIYYCIYLELIWMSIDCVYVLQMTTFEIW